MQNLIFDNFSQTQTVTSVSPTTVTKNASWNPGTIFLSERQLALFTYTSPISGSIQSGAGTFIKAGSTGAGDSLTITYIYNANGASSQIITPQVISITFNQLPQTDINLQLSSQSGPINVSYETLGNTVKWTIFTPVVANSARFYFETIFGPSTTFIVGPITSTPLPSGGEISFEQIVEKEFCNPVEKCLFGITDTSNILFGSSACDYSNLFN